MPKVKLSSKSQIVVPAEARRALGLEPGDVLDVEVQGDRILLRKETDRSCAFDRLLQFVGDHAWSGASEALERSRQEWEEYSADIARVRAPRPDA
jgi:AbrB family looped-hinge helix DNA binding protein